MIFAVHHNRLKNYIYSYYICSTKKNNMKLDRDQIIRIICKYEQELKNNYIENRDAFGSADYSTQRAVEKWLVVEELMERLELTIND